ncbi:MAG: tetratricopeptide repeat protein [Bradymonadaceae bacterium]|nr:tetratricopeptide repeat protein [Lujinxingiaceae bacterium]
MPSSVAKEIIDGRFVLDEVLSQGGVGTIWRATQLPHGRQVALKLLRAEVASLAHLRRRFAREARAASRLHHGNIAAVYEYGVDDSGRMFMSMELIDGDPLTCLVETGISLFQVLQLSDQLLAGLAHAHARGVVHRDLKPANIVVAGSELPERLGKPMIVDFGIAALLFDKGDGRDTEHGEVVGTPRYMSPEQAGGERTLTPRSDLYNVGLLVYELLTGRPPYGEHKGLAVMSLHVHEAVPPMIPRPDLPIWKELHDFVMKALEKQPANRWASAVEMRAALKPLLARAQSDPQAHRAPRPMPAEPDARPGTLEENIVSQPLDAHTIPDMPMVWDAPEATAVASFQRIPFVGRPRERAWLMDMVQRVRRTARGSLVIIDGEAGVGKTRLTMWFKEQVEEQGLLQGHIGAFTRGSNGGLRGLQEVLASMFATRGLTREAVFARVTDRLEAWGQAPREDAQTITDFLRPAGRAGDARSALASPQVLYAAVARAFELASRAKPQLVILDDIHWAGAELADFLDFLAVELRHRAVPMMVIATARTEDLAENVALASRLNGLSRYVGETVERIPLGRLKRASGNQLVNALLPVDEALTDIVFERSGGNPLHLLLLLRYLRNEGLLEWDGSSWCARDVEAVRDAVPPSLADLFRVRIQQVEERYGTGRRLSELLHRAAVAGSRFAYDVLNAMVAIEGDRDRIAHFDEDLDRLLSEGLIVESPERRDDWYSFSHALVRDYVLRDAGGPRSVRKVHKLAAKAMEQVLPRAADNHALEIAAHWHAARVPEQALSWYRKAASAARSSFMLRQASEAYEICLELMESMLGIDSATGELGSALKAEGAASLVAEYLETLVALGDLYEGFGDFPRAENAYRRIVRLVAWMGAERRADGLGALSQSWLGLGHVAWQRGDFEAAHWAFERVRELIAGDASLHETDEDAARGLARVAWHRGDYEQARALATAALGSAALRNDDDGRAESLWLLGEIARMLGHGEEAFEFYKESLALYRLEELPIGIARNLLSMAQLARYQKNFAEAARLYREALGRYESLGDRRGAGHCYNGLGDVARFESRFSEARKNYDRALDIYQGIGAQYDVAVVNANLGLTALSLADFEGARRFISSARDIIAADDYPYLSAGIEYNLALVEALRGQDEESSVILEKVLDLSERIPIADLDYAQPLEQLARLRAAAGSWQQALTLWEKARDIYRELDLLEDLARVEACIRSVR